MTQPTPRVPVTKPAKAVVAALGNSFAAAQMFLGVVTVATSDDAVTLLDVAPLVTGFVTLWVTVYGVWKTVNEPKTVAPQRF